MKIHSLELENFMLFKQFKRKFGDKDIIGIIAEYINNPTQSNKGGKTSVIEAIMWILLGISRAKNDVELIHHGADRVIGKVVLDDDGKLITIKRGRDIKGKGLLEIKGIEKKGEAQAAIDKLIGYNKDEFPLTCFFKQMDINGFMELGPTKTKAYLMQWLKNTHWSDLERAALDDLNAHTKEIAKLQTKMEAIKERMINSKEVKKDIREADAELLATTSKKEKLEKRIVQLRGERKALKELKVQIKKLDREIGVKLKAGYKLETAKKKLIRKKRELKKFGTIDLSKEASLYDKRAKLKNDIENLQDRIQKSKVNFTGSCPILCEPCDRVEYDSKKVKTWKACLVLYKSALKTTKKAMSTLAAYKDAWEAVRQQELVVGSAKVLAAGFDPLQDRMLDLEDKRRASKAKDMGDLKERFNTLQTKMSGLSERIGEYKGRLKSNKKDKAMVKFAEHQISLFQTKVADLRYVAFMFGKNGIPSQEIENAFDEVEDDINFVLERWNTTLQIEFQPDRELQMWEDYCIQCGWQFPKSTRTRTCESCDADRSKKRKDELQLRVLENGVDEGFHMESEGGKTMVSLSVRIGMTRLKQRQNHSRFNVLFLDEPDASLDKANKKAFVRLITKTLIKEFGFEQIFWISHDKEIQESIPNVLKVIRHANHSTTTWIQ